ncbi:MAG: signal recognition particle-docking protein FtsY [Bacillota bacterium]
MSFFQRLKQSLTKTKGNLVGKIEGLLARRKTIDEALYEELEEILVQADVGVDTALKLIAELRTRARDRRLKEPEQLKGILQEIIQEILEAGATPLHTGGPPAVIVVVGVNGTGKTTTIGKLAYRLRQDGQKVVLAAADTFRAAAIDQLEIWGNRAGADVIKHREGADPAAVAYDALQAARARNADVLIVDTAGRLHTKGNLLAELKKIGRVLGRELPGAPHETLLVLDATIGQNALAQAKIFKEAVGVTGIVLTKLDGTAKGGVIIGIKDALALPVKFIGIGERVEDLHPFSAREFVQALFI